MFLIVEFQTELGLPTGICNQLLFSVPFLFEKVSLRLATLEYRNYLLAANNPYPNL